MSLTTERQETEYLLHRSLKGGQPQKINIGVEGIQR